LLGLAAFVAAGSTHEEGWIGRHPHLVKAYHWLKPGVVMFFFGYGLYAFLGPSDPFVVLVIIIVAFVMGYFSIR
jgi:hypothetical protein